MRRVYWSLIVLAAISLGWFGTNSVNGRPSPIIFDISWPNCGQPFNVNPAGIVGITGGLAFRPNPCLAKQAGQFRQVSVYVNTGFPEGHNNANRFPKSPRLCKQNNETCLAYNYGYNSGLYDFDLAMKSGVIAKNWWVDVETENSWSDNPQINRETLRGVVDALTPRVGHANIGFYSYPAQWNIITGHWQNGYPAWVATGSEHFDKAKAACAQPSFTGGPVRMGQYVTALDTDYICPD